MAVWGVGALAESGLVRVVRELAKLRVVRVGQLFLVVAYVLGVLSGVFVTFRWWGWLLVALVGLAVLSVAFELNVEWLNKQLEEV